MATAKSTRATGVPSLSSVAPLFTAIMALQQQAEAGPLTEAEQAEQAELSRLETEWSNHWLTDPHDIPSRAALS